MGNGQSAMGAAIALGRTERRMTAERVQSYRDLSAWQRARELVVAVYELSMHFPSDERFGLISQIRRSAISVPSNIAEGYGRGSSVDYARFLRIARGSLYEVETQLILACDLEYISRSDVDGMRELINAAARPLSGLIRSIEQHD